MSNPEKAKPKAKATAPKQGSSHPVLNSVLGIIALVLIVFFANWLVALSAVGNSALDLTEDKVHTLTPGTRAILKDLKNNDAEVVINYYATRDSEYIPQNIKLFRKKVDSFLKRYEALAGSNLRVVSFNPEPDTDAEDSANLDGIAGVQITSEGGPIYLGLSVSFLDQKIPIQLFGVDQEGQLVTDETQLEYKLSSAIAQVARTTKPTLGLMTPFPMKGGTADMMQRGQQPTPPFVIYTQLARYYELKNIEMTPTAADLDGLAALLIVHPAGLTPETEYLLDQYLLKGGTIVAAVDAFSITAFQLSGGDPRGMATSSTFSEEMLKSWGVDFISDEVLADGAYRTSTQMGESTSVLSLTRQAFPLKDSLITKGLDSLLMAFTGGFTKTGMNGLTHTSLIRSTKDAGFVDSQRAIVADRSLLGNIPEDDQAYDLALHIQGNFKSAFPDGNPSQKAADETAAAQAEKAEQPEESESDEKPTLTESVEQGNIFLIADTDFLADNLAYRAVLGGYSPFGGNAAFLFNILDQVTGSKYLIGSRSRGDSYRPFTVVQELESEFEKKDVQEREEKQKELDEITERLRELSLEQQEQGLIVLEGEAKEEYDKALAKQAEANKALRELRKDLQREKDSLSLRYTLANVLVVPAFVILVGLGVFMKRRFSTSAR